MWARCFFLAAALAGADLGAAIGDGGVRVLTALYPEGPLWQDERLYFAEMRADRVTMRDAQGEHVFFYERGCGPTAIAPYDEGFLILCHLSAEVLTVDAQGVVMRRWTRDHSGAPLRNPNDASPDGEGGVYFSDSGPFDRNARPRGRIMHLSADGVLREVAGSLQYSNGVHVRDGELYVSEHLGNRVLRYSIAPGALLGEAEIFADLSELDIAARYRTPYPLTGPDGLEFGADGNLYVAIYGQGRLLKFSPGGELLDVIDMPTRFLTNVAFGPTAVAMTGTFDNQTPPYRGEVRIQHGLP